MAKTSINSGDEVKSRLSRLSQLYSVYGPSQLRAFVGVATGGNPPEDAPQELKILNHRKATKKASPIFPIGTVMPPMHILLEGVAGVFASDGRLLSLIYPGELIGDAEYLLASREYLASKVKENRQRVRKNLPRLTSAEKQKLWKSKKSSASICALTDRVLFAEISEDWRKYIENRLTPIPTEQNRSGDSKMSLQENLESIELAADRKSRFEHYFVLNIMRKLLQTEFLTAMLGGAYDTTKPLLKSERKKVALEDRYRALRKQMDVDHAILGVPLFSQLPEEVNLDKYLYQEGSRANEAVLTTGDAAEAYSRVPLDGQYLLAQHSIGKAIKPQSLDGKTVVDFGVGCGKSTRSLRNEFGDNVRIIGIDISPEMTFYAEREFETDKLFECRLIPQESGVWPLDDASVDVVFATIVLQELLEEEQIKLFFSEAMRVLMPGGRLIASLVGDKITTERYTAFSYDDKRLKKLNSDKDSHFRQCLSVRAYINWTKDRHWRREELLKFSNAAGFAQANVEDTRPPIDGSLGPYPGHPKLGWRDEVDSSKAAALILFTATKP